ncbi:hypothetical protein [Ancylobacter sp. G4_0304]|uniref:hypothetical protein n=1 Tax=Ancylobacter sp. G4_0304 TaxID=3114289 RepID=UPI0039C5FF6D
MVGTTVEATLATGPREGEFWYAVGSSAAGLLAAITAPSGSVMMSSEDGVLFIRRKAADRSARLRSIPITPRLLAMRRAMVTPLSAVAKKR